MKIKIHEYPKLYSARLIKRYKRFLADVRFPDGNKETAFCPNTGSMLQCSTPGSPVMLSYSASPERKTRYTLEMVKAGKVWIGTNTHLTNKIAEGVIRKGLAGKPLSGFNGEIKREFKHGDSRLDFLLSSGNKRCYVEVKNVTLSNGNGMALFPDAITARGTKHLNTLMKLVDKKTSACMIYIVQRSDCSRFSPERDIDPVYADTLKKAIKKGVIAKAYRFEVSPKGVYFLEEIPVNT